MHNWKWWQQYLFFLFIYLLGTFGGLWIVHLLLDKVK